MIGYKERVWGFDVSQYQGNFDFKAMKEAGASFCFIRASTGHTELYQDSKLARNVVQAQKHGLHAGLYHYLGQDASMHAQAQAFYAALCCANVLNLDLPIAIDIEDRRLNLDDVRAFMDEVLYLYHGRYLIYTSPAAWKVIVGDDYGPADLWVAHWNVKEPTMPSPWKSWVFWQCGQTSRREFGGKGLLDINVFNGTLPELREYADKVQRGL